ncbi:membrane-anchored junction protein isoform X1 [Sarcophilus harrisii]|uniref:Membrane anchored junction protein n=1 Tax=Sarcophilus harrisii TaxID=9305 RepID=A0A7N4PKQ0_SARHA|nr:membrane-anchored junction protein isoform X1 [Sarcophilus harrisii]XP_031798723.1 membrane-anchored junction protein isoform X1 [Sarcophilus harrisii]XP_031798725.1 membrane-anchored junction protein isoform X1 [Sarcophilus harrisii]XP_031798726.1 membrane-anchored junction protein isoform X1 [Sarcophilus harrisii]
MSLKAFTYPLPETRFLHAGSSVYKFKIRYGSSVRGEEIEDKKIVSQELEDSIRAVLGNLDNLQPFTTDHFVIFPYKSKWERVSHLRFKHGAALLEPYPFVCTLYVEMKWAPAGPSRGDSKLPDMHPSSVPHRPPALGPQQSQGSGSHLKGDDEEAEVRATAVKRRRLEGCLFSTEKEQDRPGTETSRKKEPPAPPSRNWTGESASEKGEAEDSDISFLKDHGAPAGSGSSLRHQQKSPPKPSSPPSEGPPKQKHAGFLGFLSSLFPFRLFGRRASQ